MQHLVPWVQDLVDQDRERQTQLDTLRQQRDAAAGQAAVLPPPPSVPTVSPPTDVQALIQQAVKQTLAAQAAASKDQPAATSQAPTPHPAYQPGRLVHAPSGGDGAPQQCEGHMAETLARGRKPLVPGGSSEAGAPGGRPVLSPGGATRSCEAATRHERTLAAGGYGGC